MGVEWGDWGRFVELTTSDLLQSPPEGCSSPAGRKWGDRTPFVMQSMEPHNNAITSIRSVFARIPRKEDPVGGLALGQILNKCGLIWRAGQPQEEGRWAECPAVWPAKGVQGQEAGPAGHVAGSSMSMWQDLVWP